MKYILIFLLSFASYFADGACNYVLDESGCRLNLICNGSVEKQFLLSDLTYSQTVGGVTFSDGDETGGFQFINVSQFADFAAFQAFIDPLTDACAGGLSPNDTIPVELVFPDTLCVLIKNDPLVVSIEDTLIVDVVGIDTVITIPSGIDTTFIINDTICTIIKNDSIQIYGTVNVDSIYGQVTTSDTSLLNYLDTATISVSLDDTINVFIVGNFPIEVVDSTLLNFLNDSVLQVVDTVGNNLLTGIGECLDSMKDSLGSIINHLQDTLSVNLVNDTLFVDPVISKEDTLTVCIADTIRDIEAICYYIPKVTNTDEIGWIDQYGQIYDDTVGIVSNASATPLDCDCNYAFEIVTMCADLPLGGTVQFIREIEQITGCDDAFRNITNYETDGVTPLAADISEATATYECSHPDGTPIITRCFLCEYVAPVINPSSPKPIKEQIKSAAIKLQSIKKRYSKSEAKIIAKGKVKYVNPVPPSPCAEGGKAVVKFQNGNVIEVDDEPATDFDSTGFVSYDCDIEICPPLTEATPVKVLNEINVDWSPICDTCLIGNTPIDPPNELTPYLVEAGINQFNYNPTRPEDPDNELVNGLPYVAPTSQTLNLYYDFSWLPPCAVINEVKLQVRDGAGSGVVFWAAPVTTGTNTTIYPNTFNGGAAVDARAWIRYGNGCGASASYTQIEALTAPCGTNRPTPYTGEMTLTSPTLADLQNMAFVISAVQPTDTIYFAKVLLDYNLPTGCDLLVSEITPIVGVGETEIKKVINVAIDAACITGELPITGTVTVEEPCFTTSETKAFCLGTAIPSLGLAADTTILLLTTIECKQKGGGIIGSEYITLDGTVITEPVDENTNCTPAELQELESCVQDKDKNTYTKIVVIKGGVVISTIYINSVTLSTVMNIGEEFPCPPDGDAFTRNEICAFIQGEPVCGDEISYFTNGELTSYLITNEGKEIVDYDKYCCDDCLQFTGCFDPLFERFDSISIGGVVYDLTVINGGTDMTLSNLTTWYNANFLGSLESGEIAGGINITGCLGTDLYEIIFTNADKVDYLLSNAGGQNKTYYFETIGNCLLDQSVTIDNDTLCVVDKSPCVDLEIVPICIQSVKSGPVKGTKKNAKEKATSATVGQIFSVSQYVYTDCKTGEVLADSVYFGGKNFGALGDLKERGFRQIPCPLPQDELPSFQPTGDPLCFTYVDGGTTTYLNCQLFTDENDVTNTITTYKDANTNADFDADGLTLNPCPAGTITTTTEEYQATTDIEGIASVCNVAIVTCITNNAITVTQCDTIINDVLIEATAISFVAPDWAANGTVECPKDTICTAVTNLDEIKTDSIDTEHINNLCYDNGTDTVAAYIVINYSGIIELSRTIKDITGATLTGGNIVECVAPDKPCLVQNNITNLVLTGGTLTLPANSIHSYTFSIFSGTVDLTTSGSPTITLPCNSNNNIKAGECEYWPHSFTFDATNGSVFIEYVE